jgi:hypothetical protein
MRLHPLAFPLLLLTGCGEGRLVATFEETFRLDGASEILLENGSGDLHVIGESDRDDVTLFVELRSHRASDLQDDNAEDDLVMDVRVLDEATAQIVAWLDDPPAGYEINVTAFVPEGSVMRVEDGSGDITVETIAALELIDDSGDLRVEGVAGDVAIDDDSGDIHVRDVQGELEIDDDSGDIHVRGVAEDADIRDDSGDINVVAVGGTVTVRDNSGDILIADAGDVHIESDGSGDVHIE